MDEKYQEMMAQRQKQIKEWTENMEINPRCGLLPSPEQLDLGFDNPGKDDTDTRKDFNLVHKWLAKINALNQGFYAYYKTDGKFLKDTEYGALIQLAFSNSFAAMRHTFKPELPEYVIWYYTGHGFDPKGDSSRKSSTPNLKAVNFNTEYNNVADEFAKELQDVPVKGGELCLHHVGYSGLYGLLRPWIAALKSESMNSQGREKKNKYLIIILDSCYSGIIAQDLQELNKRAGPWNQNGCTVTIQTACGPNEPTYGGYFTPCFLTLNQDQTLLEGLKKEWGNMDENLKMCYRTLPQPSPKVVTTSDDEQITPLTLQFHFNNSHQVTLFPDPGFFKFCSLTIFEHEEEKLMKTRLLDTSTIQNFMTIPNFTVLDYKLKTLQEGPYAGHPMGLFLLADPNKSNFAVCAHVHFAQNDTSKVGRINLVHHKMPPKQNLLYVEDHDGLSKFQVKKSKHQFEYAAIQITTRANPQGPNDWEYWSWNTPNPSTSVVIPSHIADASALQSEVNNGARLVNECCKLVERNEPGRWADISRWNMTSNDLSYSGMFRRKERSEWMNKYLEKNK